MNDISPNPELMEQYGTDVLFLQNLEKRADSIFGQPTADLSQSEWGRLMTGQGQEQAGTDRHRMDAAALNLKFRHMESGRMADTIEHAGGPGTRRARFTRAMMYQPYALHPMMMMGGMGGMRGAMMGGAGGGYITPPGTGDFGRPTKLDIPESGPDPQMQQLEGEMGQEMAGQEGGMEVAASASWAKLAAGNPYWSQQPGGMSPPPPQPLPVDAHVQAAQGQLGESAKSLGHSAGQAAMAAGHGFGQLAQRTGTAAQKAVQAARSGKRGPQKPSWLTRMGKGVESFMSQDIQPTPRWGTGMPPAANVNQYGVPIW